MKLEDIKIGAKIIWSPPPPYTGFFKESHRRGIGKVGEVIFIHHRTADSSSFRMKFEIGIELEFSTNQRLLDEKVFTLAGSSVKLNNRYDEDGVLIQSEANLDWKKWRDAGLQANECVCRIPRDRCDYHK